MEIDPTSIAFGVYSDVNSGILIPAYADGVSKIQFLANGNESTIYNSPGAGFIISAFDDATIIGDNVRLSATGGSVWLPSWSSVKSNATGQTLQSALSSLQSSIDSLWTYLASKPWI